MILREYQQRGVDQIRARFAAGVRRVLYTAPTGSGKTVLFAYIARGAAAKGKRVCILVHRRELVLQTCARLDYPHAVIAAGFPADPRQTIQVASVQTLINRLGQYPQFDLIVVDEAHHCRAASYETILAMHPAARVLGVTATPCRLDGRGLGDLFQELIHGPSVRSLIDDGYLAEPIVYAPSMIDTAGVHRAHGDYVTRELAAVADRPTITGDAITHYRRYADRIPGIAFCVSVEHARHVAADFQGAGYIARCVDGGTPQAERDHAIAALGSGRIHMVTSCDLISEGVDVPIVGCGIMLRPTQSTALAIQQTGRCLRTAPGKRRAIILDHAGNTLRHGLPDDDRDWTLEHGHARRAVSGDDDKVSVRICPHCFYAHATGPVCPGCGYEYPIEGRDIAERDGELVLQTREEKLAEQAAATDFNALVDIEVNRRYKPGWALHVWRTRGHPITFQEYKEIEKRRGYKPGWAWIRSKMKLSEAN